MKFTNTKKKNNNEGLLYKTGVSRPLEDMGAGASHSTYTESVQDRIGTHNQEMEDIHLRQQRRQRNRQELQMAIELAKQNASSNSNVNAGDNRTTAYNKPQSISVYGGYGTLPNPATQGMNTAANGAKIDYSAVSQKAKEADTQNKGWKGLNFGKDTENISTEDSVKNATKALSGYDSNQLDLLEQYVKASDNDEASIFMAALTKDYSNLSTAEQSRKDQARIKEEFMKNSGVSEEEFNNLVQYASYMSHYNAEQSLKEQIQNSSGLTKAALSVADVATFPAQSMMDLGDRIVHDKPTAPGIGRDNHNFYTALHDISQDTEESVLNEADTIENPFLREAAKFGYQTTMAAGKSYTAAMTGDVGLLFFGSSAYTDAARDAEERGLDDTQVQLYAITAGLTEMATEKIPQDHLRSLIFGGEASEAASKGFKETLKQIAIQMAEEGNEEAVNDVVNTITDALIAGDKSQANIDYQNYIANGMTEDQALKQVIWDKAKEIGYDYAVGAVSGGMSAGAAVGFNAGMETHAGRTIAKDSEVNNAVLEDISSNMDAYESQEAYDQAQQTRKDVISAASQRLSGKQARELYRNVVQATDNAAQTRTNMIKAANEDVQIRKEIANQPDTYKAPEKTQAQIVEDIEFASTPYELAKAIEAVKTETDEIKELIAFKRQELVDFGANEKDVDNAITPKKAFEMGQKGEQVTEDQLKSIPERDRQEVLENNNYQLNKTIIRENPTAIIDKESGRAFIPAEVKVDGSEVVVLDEAGNEHKELFNPRITRVESVLSQVSKDFNTGRYTDQSKYNTTVQQAAYAIDMAINSPEAEPMLIGIATQSIFDNASVGSKTWSEYVKGTHGMFTKIDQTAAEKLYNEVREQARKSDSAKQENTKGQRTHNETVSKTLRENLSDEAVALYEALGKKIGYDFVASTNKDARGDINPATRTISIGANNIDEMWAVANHEAIAEYLQAHGNEKDLMAVQDDMLNYLEEKLGSLEYNNLINAYQSAYRTGAKEGSVDEGKSRRAAANEMFNDTVFALMSSEEGTKDFINWVTENNTPAEQKTILQRAKDFFKKIFDYIQNYVHSGSFNAAEQAALEMDAKQARELRKRIFKLMDEAIANANRDVKSTLKTENEIAKSIKIDANGKNYVDIQENIIEGITDDNQIKNYVKEYLNEYYPSLDMMGFDLPVTAKSRNEFTNSEYTKRIQKKLHSLFIDKMRLSANLEEIVSAAEGYSWEKIKHSRKDNIIGFVRGQAQIRVGNNDYIADIILADRKNAGLMFYDIVSMLPTNIKAAVGNTTSQNVRGRSTTTASNNIVTSTNKKTSTTSSKNSISVDTNGRSLSEGQKEYFADSKVVDEDGRLKVVFHGTQEEFYEFKPREKGGKNARVEGYGIYFAENQAITNLYGDRQLEGYLNITKPAYSDRKTIKTNDLAKLIKATCEAEARLLMEDGGYDSLDEAIKDTWVSNIVDTYSSSMQQAYKEAAETELGFADNDKDIIHVIMNDVGVHNYNDAYDFYEILTATLGFDGFITDWEANDGEINTVYIAFNSNQFKNIDNLNPTDNADIRYSKKIDQEYMTAVDSGNIEKMQQLVDQAAREAGYNSPLLYHGTENFGFTEFDLDRMDDKRTIFLTSNNNIASTYSGTLQNKAIDDRYKDDINNITAKELVNELNKNRPDDGVNYSYEYYDLKEIDTLKKNTIKDIKKLYEELPALLKTTTDEKALNALKKIREIQMLFNAEDAMTNEKVKKDLSTAIYMAINHSDALNEYKESWDKIQQNIRKAYALDHHRRTNDKEYVVENYLDGYLFEILTPFEAKMTLSEKVTRGNYSLYAKLGKSFVVDAKNALWNNLRYWPESYTNQFNKENTSVVIDEDEDRAYLVANQGDILLNISANEKYLFDTEEELHEDMLERLPGLYRSKAILDYDTTTRGVAAFAKVHGYDSVVIKNVRDNGGRNHKIDYDETADVYMLFNPNDIKSADPVTYDNDGNVIPLSERFNAEESDLRFSKKITDTKNKLQSDLQQWDGKNPRTKFEVGFIAGGVATLTNKRGKIVLDAKKLIKIQSEHPEMAQSVIESLPEMLAQPVAIMDSKSYSSRIVVFGDLQGTDGKTVVAVLEMNPDKKGITIDDIKLASAYGKNNLQNLINSSNVLWMDNKKRSNWMMRTRLQLPVGISTTSNYILPSVQQNATTTSSSNMSDNARNSFKVYGEASPYADSINESKVVAAMIGSINNSLPKTDVFAMPNDELLRIERFITNKYKVNMSEIEEGEIAANISYAFAYMQNNKLDKDYENMMNYLLNIGDEVIKNSNMKDPATEEIYNNTKKILASHKFKLSDAERAEISNAFGGSWKAAFGAINKAGIKLDNKNGQPVDDLFSEIKQEILNTAGIDLTESDKPSEQILALIDTMTALEPTAYLWEGANDMDKALTVVTDIVEQYYSAATEQLEKNVISGTEKGKAKIKSSVDKEKARLRGEWAKYKDKKQKEFDEVVAEKNRIIQQQQNQLRQQDEQMKKWNSDLSAAEKKLQQSKILTEKQMRQTARLQAQQTLQSYKDRQERAKQIDNIKKTGIRLIKWLTNPTDAQHVPEFLQKPLGEFLGAIDFLPKNAKANSKSTLTWQQRMNALREVLRQIEDAERNGENTPQAYFAQNVIAKELVSMMDEFLGKETWDEFTQSYIVSKRAASKVSKLDAKDLATLNKIMSALSAGINNMNKTYANEQFKEISKLSRESVKEIDALPAKKARTKAGGTLEKLLRYDELEPITYFESLGNGAKSVFDELRQGFNVKTRHVREADEYMSKVKEDLGLTDIKMSDWKNQTKVFDLSEGKVELTVTQIMSLYEILNRKQGKPHVAIGGIKAGDVYARDENGKFIKKNKHQAKAVHIRSSEAQAIINTLTDEQRALADAMQKFMANECSSWGNRVTEKMFGYKKYEEKDYFPLKTDANTRATTASSDNNVSYYSIKNSSFTEPITPMANNAVVIDDIFDVFTDHVVKMADYDAYVMPIADAMRWFNYSEKTINAVVPDELNEAGQRVDYIGNMQESIDRAMGSEGLQYFRQFIKDINGDYAGRGGVPDALNSLMGMYKAAAVGANIRVVIQQPTAIIRAADVIETEYLVKAYAGDVATLGVRAMKYAKKAQANSEIAYWKAQGYYETYLGQSFKEIITGDKRLRDWLTDAAGWAAGKADDLSWGIMYHAAELKVQKIMPQLKVDSAEYTKEVVKIFEDIVDHTQVVDTIFHKSQYMRNQGLGYKITSAFMAEPTKTYNMIYRAYYDSIYLKKGKKYTLKRLSKVALIFVIEQLVNAIRTALWDSLRDDEKESYLEGLKSAFLENSVDNLLPLNLVPISKDIVSFFHGYDATSYIYDGLENLINTILADKKYIMNYIHGKEQSKTLYGISYQNVKALSQLSGIPFANVMRDVTAIHNTINDTWGGKDWYKTTATEKKAEKTKAQKYFHEAFQNNDIGAMNNIYKDAIAAGKTESDAWSDVRDALEAEFTSQVQEKNADVNAISNHFTTLLKQIKYENGTKYMTDTQVANKIETWKKNAGIE